MFRRSVLAAFAIVLAIAIAGCSSSSTKKTATSALNETAIPTVNQPATVTASGLQVIDLAAGDGAEARAGSIVHIYFQEWLSDGTFLDTTTVDGTPTPVRQMLRSGQIIEGLVQGIPGMKVGGRRRLIIPPDLGFGAQGDGAAIPPNATLIYDIQLVEVR